MNVKLLEKITNTISKEFNIEKEGLDVEVSKTTVSYAHWKSETFIEVEVDYDLEKLKIKLNVTETRRYEEKLPFKLSFNLEGLQKLLDYITQTFDIEKYEISINTEMRLVKLTSDNTVINILEIELPIGYEFISDDDNSLIEIIVKRTHELYINPPKCIKREMELKRRCWNKLEYSR